MRNMSFSLTTKQMHDRSKTVTRRLGWWDLKPGDIVMAVEKSQGLKKGEKVVQMYPIRIINVRRQQLFLIDKWDCVLEGFPHLSPSGFVDMFCGHNKCGPLTEVARIEFEEVL